MLRTALLTYCQIFWMNHKPHISTMLPHWQWHTSCEWPTFRWLLIPLSSVFALGLPAECRFQGEAPAAVVLSRHYVLSHMIRPYGFTSQRDLKYPLTVGQTRLDFRRTLKDTCTQAQPLSPLVPPLSLLCDIYGWMDGWEKAIGSVVQHWPKVIPSIPKVIQAGIDFHCV